MKKKGSAVALRRLIPILLVLGLLCCDGKSGWLGGRNSEPVTISFSCLNDWHMPSKLGPEVIVEFSRQTGIVVRTLPYGEELAQRRAQDLKWLELHSSTPDVYESDIIRSTNHCRRHD